MAVYYIVTLCTLLIALFTGFVENEERNNVTDIMVVPCNLPCKRQHEISIFIAIALIGLLQLVIPILRFTFSTRLTTLGNEAAAGDVKSSCKAVTQKNQTVQTDLRDPRIQSLEEKLQELSCGNARLLKDNCQLECDNRLQNRIVADLTISLKTLLKETEQHVPMKRKLRERVEELNGTMAILKTELDQRESEASALRVRSEELAICVHQAKQALAEKSRECTNLRRQVTTQRVQIYKNPTATHTLVAPGTPVVAQVTPAVAATVTPAVTPAMNSAVTATPTPGVTPDVTPAMNPAVTAIVTPAVNPAVTPAVTATATPAESPAVTPAVTATVTPAESPAVTPAVTPAAAQRSSSGPRLGSTLRRMFTRRKAAPVAEAECATVLPPGSYHLIIPVAESYVIQAAELERLKTVPLQTVLNSLR